MRIIFVKHLNSEKEFLFEVPCCLNAKYGDVLAVNTYRGLAIAIASSNIETVSETVAVRLGARMPLKTVLFRIGKEEANIVAMAIEKNLLNQEDIPF